MTSLLDFASAKLVQLERESLRRDFVETQRDFARSEGPIVLRKGLRLVSFSCNDYLNLSQHPAIKAAAVAAIETYGTGAGASRLVTGDHPLFAELEAALARFKGTDAALVFGSGYLVNLGTIPALASEGDLILIDELAHACIYSSTRLSAAATRVFRHNDVDHAREILQTERARFRNALLVTETVFSMDGDRAPIAALTALCADHEVWLMTDDAHGLGVVAQSQEDRAGVPLQMGSLSKALGSYGGYLCAAKPVIDLLKTRARTLLFETGLPPASVASALAALAIVEADPQLRAKPLAKARAFTRALDLPEAQSPIVPLILGSAAAALAASKLLEDEGYLVVAIRPPTVPENSARLRFAFSAGHNDADIIRLAEIVRERVPYRREMSPCPLSS